MRILFFGDGKWGTDSLNRLISDNRQIVGLVIRRHPTDPGLVQLAERHGLPVYQPHSANAAEFIQTVSALQPDLNVSVSYDQILKDKIRGTAPLGFINIHAGKLPCYRGRNVINWALINGETEIGITAHYVDAGIDTGDVILQRVLPIAWEDTYGEVLNQVIAVIPELVSETVGLIADRRVKRFPQRHLPGTYFAARGEDDEWIDWRDSSRNIYNKVRAITQPGPGARTWVNRQVAVIWSAAYDPQWPVYNATPGQVVGRRVGKGIVVKTGDSVLEINEVETEALGVFVPDWPIGTRLGIDLMKEWHDLVGRVDRLESELQRLTGGDLP